MIYKFIVIYIKINYMVHKNKKTIISNTLCLSFGILLPISTQILTISCTAIKSSNDNAEQEIILKPLRSLPGIDCERAYVYPSIWNKSIAVANGKISISRFEIERQPSDACVRLNSFRVDIAN